MKRLKNLKKLLYSTLIVSLIILGSVNVFARGETDEPSGESTGKPTQTYILIENPLDPKVNGMELIEGCYMKI